ncbi:MAG: LPS assembly protein LptD, partial [Candidatus Competibacterales bacterium]|nr:LPS assembly protein LptD [Candidatus Competibacterales bacterium]
MPVIRGRSGWLVLLLWSVAASAQEPARGPWALCQADPLQGLLTPDTGADPKTSPLRFTADSGEVSPLAALLSGSVVAEKGDLRLEAPMVDVDRQANLVIADDVRYGSPELAITSDHAEVDLNRERGVFDQARYYFPSLNARGQATQVEVERRGQFSRLHEANYTTCTRDSPFWQLRTGELELDRDTGRGKARDITFVIGGLPLLYLPYLSFPIDDQRQSGWLVPEAGYDSEGGFDLTLPYYWNIAPARDATLRPRLITDRGLMLGAEYRFLTPRSRGQLNAEFLPDDQVFGDNRSSFKIEHRAQPLTGLYTDLLYQEVSDDDYLDDLGDNIGLLSPDYLDRHLDLNYRTRRWQAGLRVQAFQILDRALFPPGDEPYDRLPQLTFDGSWPARFGGLNLAVRGELTRFEHDLRIDGTRADLETGFGWPLEWPAGFLR